MAFIDKLEPARVRAVYTAVVALLATLGVTLPSNVDGWVTGLLAVLAVVLPLVQGELTRAKVTPVVRQN